MPDKPIPARINLTLSDINSTGEDFIALSGELYKQNLIFAEPRELRRNKNRLELIIIFRDVSSFKRWIKNPEIKKNWSNRFKNFLSTKPETIQERDVIIEVDEVRNCECKNIGYLILQGRSSQFMPELTCSDCLGEISYSRIPLEIQIEEWQCQHQRVCLNWLESGVFEKDAFTELTNFKKGKLNIQAQIIRKQLSEYFTTPVYICYFSDSENIQSNCPVCGSLGKPSGLKRPARICKMCNAVFGED